MTKDELAYFKGWMELQEEISKEIAFAIKHISERLAGIERRLAEMEAWIMPTGNAAVPAINSQPQGMWINGELWKLCNRCRAHYPPGHVCVFCER